MNRINPNPDAVDAEFPDARAAADDMTNDTRQTLEADDDAEFEPDDDDSEDDDDAEPEEVAKWFLKNQNDVWSAWLPADVAARVKAAL